MPLEDKYSKNKNKNKKDDMILNLYFLVELHLDDVHEVLLVVGVEFLTNDTCI